jgi:threonine synthase
MRFISTRGEAPAVSISEAIAAGLAPDGGLYVPERFPEHDPAALDDLRSLPEIAARVLAPFFDGDPLAPHLEEICRGALDFPVPLEHLRDDTAVLELFHGPTAAFKDFAARFLAWCFRFMPGSADPGASRTILVATSGDTGSAVAAAFHRTPGIEVVVLFPEHGVSERQKHLLSCFDGNVHSFAVRGTFDDCQALVKQAFQDEAIRAARDLSSANSINVGRLLPQAVYYSAASMQYRRETGAAPGVIVPSGNLGNSVGAFWSRRMGFPLRELRLAVNANAVVSDWFHTGEWRPRTAVPTLANAMDVGNPSNFERLTHLHPDLEHLRGFADSASVDDDAIRDEIRRGPERWGRVWCPHTATAAHLRRHETAPHWILVATAHPAKFDSIVEPLVGHAVEPPPALAELLRQPARFDTIDADPAELRRRLT